MAISSDNGNITQNRNKKINMHSPPGSGKMLEPSSSEEEDEEYLQSLQSGQTHLEPPGVHQNGGPPRAVSPGNMSVDGVNKGMFSMC